MVSNVDRYKNHRKRIRKMHNIKKLLKEIALIYKGMGFVFTLKYILYILKNLSKVLRTKSLGCVDQEFKEDFNVKFNDHSFTFPFGALPTTREIYLKNCYNISEDRKNICIDLGANRGIVSALLSKFSNKIIAIEMLDEFQDEFNHIKNINEINNIEYLQYAITSKSENDNEITMNDLIQRYKIKQIDFLKMDIEGAEEDVILNNNQWLSIVKEMGIEVHPPFGIDLVKIVDELEKFNFNIKLLDMEFKKHTKESLKEMGYIWATKK
jgi:Na+-transporting methylmalonyl-CoA/oxaloacetate decarboxylase gamma subunit